MELAIKCKKIGGLDVSKPPQSNQACKMGC